MRQKFERILGEELRYFAIETRERLGLTQKEMGEDLQMGETSYSEFERSEIICASVPTASPPMRILNGMILPRSYPMFTMLCLTNRTSKRHDGGGAPSFFLSFLMQHK